MHDPQLGAARFDPGLSAWVLTGYADVSAALREPRLAVTGAEADGHGAHLAVREAGAEALAPARLAALRTECEPSAHTLAASLPEGRPVDLVRAFAEPWSRGLAASATGATPADLERLSGLAREVFLAAASATDGTPEPGAQAAAAELARSFQGAAASIAVQTFVALTHTLPCLLANAWLELLRHPQEILSLRARPELMPQAVEELLRHASPARAVFRQALAPVSIGGASIGPGQRVILMLSSANRDPAQFPEPDQLNLSRGPSGHLAFGRGTHSCTGAQVIRMATAVATGALLAQTCAIERRGDVEWIGGFAIRAVSSLPVVIRREATNDE